jgi:hypothetical protein
VNLQYEEGRVTHITDKELKDQLNIIMKEEMASLR